VTLSARLALRFRAVLGSSVPHAMRK
jgi:hypothetical protein